MYRLTIVVLLAFHAMQCLAADSGQKAIPGWGVAVDPDGDCRFELKDSALTITAPGPVHDLSAELQRMNAPRVLRSASGDFAVETSVKGTFKPGEATIPVRTAYHGAGLLLMADDRTYIRLDRATLVRAGTSRHYANFELRNKGKLTRFGTPIDYAIDPERDTLLRLERKGNVVSAAVSQQPGEWHDLGIKEAELPDEVLVGVAAINASTQPFQPVFEGFKIVQAAIEIESSPSDLRVLDRRAGNKSGQTALQVDSTVQAMPCARARSGACHGRCRARIWRRIRWGS